MEKSLALFLSENEGKQVIAVQGLGFVGSVLALICTNAINGDYAVIGIEQPNKRRKKIIEKGNFFATSDVQAHSLAQVIIVDVNLEVDKKNDIFGAFY
tara:strand:+ start:132 stop:425 length:294 start_codon:yes stop_codon:yes gene_type:complete